MIRIAHIQNWSQFPFDNWDLFHIYYLVLCFLLGSIPSGFLLGWWVGGVDVRKSGSGNIGATNVVRTLGKKIGFFTFLFDFVKGAVAVLLGIYFFPSDNGALWIIGGLLTVLGHTRSIYLKLQGGKGVATTFGVMLVLDWRLFASLAISWLGAFALTRVSFLSAISAFLLFPIQLYFLYAFSPVSILFSLLGFYVIALHYKNIAQTFK